MTDKAQQWIIPNIIHNHQNPKELNYSWQVLFYMHIQPNNGVSQADNLEQSVRTPWPSRTCHPQQVTTESSQTTMHHSKLLPHSIKYIITLLKWIP